MPEAIAVHRRLAPCRALALAGASLLPLILIPAPAKAGSGNILGGARGRAAVTQATAAAVVGAQQAAAASQQSLNALSRTAQALQAMQNAQTSARNLSVQAPGAAPNGLVAGGLAVASGIAADPALWQNANLPTQTKADGQTVVTVKQNAQKAILTWNAFNVGQSTTVDFDQTGGTEADGSNNWVVLNRVTDPSGLPSQILGRIKAAGSVYLLNANGVMFGGASQIDVHTLVASSLDLFSSDLPTSNADFLNHGIGDQTWLDQGNYVILTAPGANRGAVTIESGAQIVAQDLGMVLIAAPNVANRGSISATDGQIGLIAGNGVEYLFQNGPNGGTISSPNTNALQFFNYSALPNASTAAGRLVNDGLIESVRGDATLLGGAVEQDGLVISTTSVSRPGSITIAASYGVTDDRSGNAIEMAQSGLTGPATFGTGSVTAILPDDNGATAPTASIAEVRLGSITLGGLSLDFKGGSLTYAPGQTIDAATALDNLTANQQFPANLPVGAGRILIQDGAVIDVSGVPDVELPIASTTLTEILAGNELADSPLQKAGFLYGKTVTVDATQSGTRSDGLAWVGTPLADLSGYVGLIPQSIDQILTNGGTASFQGAEFAFAPGAVINLAGGYIHYLGGVVDTTRLVGADGHLYDIGGADPNLTYVGFAGQFAQTHPHWGITQNFDSPLVAGGSRYVGDYIQGGDAGALTIQVSETTIIAATAAQVYIPGAGAIVLGGRIDAQSFAGLRQVESGQLPVNASLSIESELPIEIGDSATLSTAAATAASLPADYNAQSPLLAVYPAGQTPPPIPYGTQPPPPAATPYANPYLDTAAFLSTTLDQANFNSLSIESDKGAVSVDTGAIVQVQNGGAITLEGQTIDVGGALVARAGAIMLHASYAFGGVPVPYAAAQAQPGDSVVVGPRGLLDVSGLFVNDRGATDATLQGGANLNGGAIAISVDGGEATDPLGATVDTTGNIVLATGSRLDLNGGGRIQQNGQAQMNGAVPAGDGGSLSLIINGGEEPNLAAAPTRERLKLNGVITALGFGGGGTLALGALAVQIGGDPNPALRPAYAFYFDPSYWGQAGFATFKLQAAYDAVIPDGAAITLRHDNFIPDLSAIAAAPTGADPAAYASAGVLPIGLRTPTSLSVSAGLEHKGNDAFGDTVAYPGIANYRSGGGTDTIGLSLDQIVLGRGAKIVGDPSASVSLSSIGQVSIYGDIAAPGGTVALKSGGYFDIAGVDRFGVLYLGPHSVIDVAGEALPTPLAQPALTAQGIVTPDLGTVLAGGSVSLTDYWGPVVVSPGALIDVSGAAANFDSAEQQPTSAGLSQIAYVSQPVWSNAGQVSIYAATGLLFQGTLIGKAGAVLAAGGVLTISQDGGSSSLYGTSGATPFPNQDPSIVLVQDTAAAEALGSYYVPLGYRPGMTLPSSENSTGSLLFGVDTLANSGFDSLVLTSGEGSSVTVAFSGTVKFTLRGDFVATNLTSTPTFTLESGIIALPAGDFNPLTPAATGDGALTVGAGYIALSGDGATLGNDQSRPAPLPSGDGRLSLTATAIDLIGAVGLGDIGKATLVSRTDLRLLPYQPADAATEYEPSINQYESGEFASSGDITLDAARTYPATDTVFAIETTGTNATVRFGYPAGITADTAVPLSAGGALVVDAANIAQGGDIAAPFGQIVLGVSDATPGAAPTAGALESAIGLPAGSLAMPTPVVTTQLSLETGGITSASGAGTIIPYGSTIDGTSWVYDPLIDTVSAAIANASWSASLTAPPAKAITLVATKIAIGRGATVDLAGGGDLQAAEWVPGVGGSRDLLSATNISYSTGNATATAVSLYPDGRAVYAILPGYGGSTAPFDPYIDEGLTNPASGQAQAAGQSVYLSGVPGLAAGVYTLLPGKYATLPGAYRVVVDSGVTDPLASQLGVQPDGSVQAAGYFINPLTGTRSALSSEFLVQPAAVWEKYSQYTLTSANSFFPAYAAAQNDPSPVLPMDAGHLVIGETATTSLALDGTTLTAPASADALGAQIDIVAQKIEIVADADQSVDPGYIAVTAAELDSLRAGSLLVGGVRTTANDGTIVITPDANGVIVANDAATPLAAPEIFLVATPALAGATPVLDAEGDQTSYVNANGVLTPVPIPIPAAGSGQVVLRSGSVVEAEGGFGAGRAIQVRYGGLLADLPSLPGAVKVSLIESQWLFDSPGGGGTPIDAYYNALTANLGAILQVSNGPAVSLNIPTPAELNPAPITVVDDVNPSNPNFIVKLPSLASGSGVVIQGGAQVLGGQTLTIAGGGGSRIAADATLGGRNLLVAGGKIVFAGAGVAPSGAVVIDTASGALFRNIGSAVFQSAGSIDFQGKIVALTAPSGTIALSAGLFTDSGGGAVTITAATVALTNDLSGASIGPSLPPAGSLTIDAGEVDFGAGAKTLAGFGQATVNASAEIVAKDSGNLDFGSAAVTFNAPAVVAASDSAQTLQTGGAFAISAIGAAAAGAAPAASGQVGGALTLIGASVSDDAPIDALAGNVTIAATTGDVALQRGAAIDVAAVARQFYDVTQYASAGAIVLTADVGSVRVGPGTSLDVSATAAGGGDAGSLSVTATGANGGAMLAGSLSGGAAKGFRGGSFSLDVAGAQDFDALAATLGGGGFAGAVSVHTRAGDLTLGGRLAASQVTLTADGGMVAVTGTIDASGAAGGAIDLYGAAGVDIEGALLATASSAAQRGGSVEIGATGVWNGTLNQTYGYENITNSGAITVGAHAVIDVSGGSAGGNSGGDIVLRAPLLADGDVNVQIASGAALRDTVIGGGKATGGVALDAYSVWSTTDPIVNPNQHFDGIIDPAGWYDGKGDLVAGVFTTQAGSSFAYTPGSLTAAELAADLTNDYFTPGAYNAAHAVFYGGYDPDSQTFNPASPDAGSLPAFIQAPGFTFGARFAGIAGLQVKPEIDLVNPSATVNGGGISVLTNWNLAAGVCNNAACSSLTLAYRYQGTIAPVIRVAAAGDVLIKATISDGFFQSQGVQLPTAPNPITEEYNDSVAMSEFDADTNKVSGSESIVFNDNATQTIDLVDPNYAEAAPRSGGSTFYYENYEGYLPTYDTWSFYFGAFQGAYVSITAGVAAAPSVSAYKSYSSYLAAYETYVDATFVTLKTGTPPPPAPPKSLGDYQAYMNVYNNFYLDVPYNQNYVTYDPTGSYVTGITYTYAPAPPMFQKAPPPVVLPAPPNLPSNMGTASNPLPTQFATLIAGESASYRIIAGAALASADPQAVGAAGDVVLDGHTAYADQVSLLTVAAPTVIRTGTGFIDISAGGDLTLADATAPGAIYTAGAPVAGTVAGGAGAWVTLGAYIPGNPGSSGLTFVQTDPAVAAGAGNITIRAGGDIQGGEQAYDATGAITGVAGSYIGQHWSAWLTSDPADPNVAWYVNFGDFDQGVLSMGGDVTVVAGGDIRDFSVSLPTTATIVAGTAAPGAVASLDGQSLVYTGGGTMTVAAGGGILSGDYYLGQGTGSLLAGDAIGSDFAYAPGGGFSFPPSAGGDSVATLLAVQNGAITAGARRSAEIGGVFDPADLTGEGGLSVTSMTASSAVTIDSTAGSAILNSFDGQTALFSGYLNSQSYGSTSILLPASLAMVAFDGDIAIDRGGGLFPSASGELSLLANQNIALNSGGGLGQPIGNIPSNVLAVLDYPLNTGILPNALDPVLVNYATLSPNATRDPAILHAGDPSPVRIYSLAGAILDGGSESYPSAKAALADGSGANELAIQPDKRIQVEAAGNIVDLVLYGQNDAATDVSSVIAGGDIIDLPINQGFQAATPPVLELAGPGYLDIEAGGSITFDSQRFTFMTNPETSGFTQSDIETGIRTIGNSIDAGPEFYQGVSGGYNTGGAFGDPYLPQGGGSISVLFGVGKGVDYQAFVSRYLDPATATGLGDLAAAIDTAIGGAGATEAQGWALFQALPADRQRLLVQDAFFQILNRVGLDYNQSGSPYYHQYARGYQAIGTLFPAADGYTANALSGGTNGANRQVATGSLDLRGSTIQTQQGGNIALLGPGGSILAGTEAPPPSYVQPSSEGVITVERGDIDTFTDGSVDVAQSRIMTEQGGDIVMWSSNGDLDAGKGAKTSVSFPPPVYSCDLDYYCTQDAKGLVTGAGIATLQTIPGAALGDANLIAPRGTVDAGAAGIRVSGNLNIAALRVANAFNIQVQGVATGVPGPAVPNFGALNRASNDAGAAAAAASQVADQSRSAGDVPSIITVEVVGYGGGSDDPDENHDRRRDKFRPGG